MLYSKSDSLIVSRTFNSVKAGSYQVSFHFPEIFEDLTNREVFFKIETLFTSSNGDTILVNKFNNWVVLR
jgi:hypothetical protein